MQGKLAGWLVNLALVMMSTVLALAVIDLGIAAGRRVAGHDEMYRFDPVLGWRVLPALNRALTPYPTYTDEHGFRILPGEPRNESSFDVMLLGDSFCFGSWLRVERTLAGMLKLRHPELRIANTAVPGWGTDQEYLALRRYAPMLKPGGTVVLLTYINDFDDIREHFVEFREKPWYAIAARGIVLQPPDSWLNRFCWSAQVFSIGAELATRALRIKPAIHGSDLNAAALYAELLERMAAIVRTRNARFVVLYTGGLKARTAAGLRWAAVARAAAAHADATFFSLDDIPGGMAPATFIPDDIHWDAPGTLAVYNYIAPRLDPFLRR